MPYGIYEDEDYAWFPDLQMNGFFRVEKAGGQAELLFHFPKEEVTAEFLYSKPEKVEDWFVFTPRSAQSIFLYHTVTQEQKTIPLKPVKGSKKIRYRQTNQLANSVQQGNFVYFFPATYPAILKLNMSTFQVEYLTSWIGQLEGFLSEDIPPQLNGYFINKPFLPPQEDRLFLPCTCTNAVFEFDFTRDQGQFHKIEGAVTAFQQVIYQEGYFWLTPKQGNLLTKWNKETGESSTLPLVAHWDKPWPLVGATFAYAQHLYMMATRNSHCYRLDVRSEQVEVLDFLEPLIQQEKSGETILANNDFFAISAKDQWVRFVSGRDLRWYTANLETEELSSFSVTADPKALDILSQKQAFFKREWRNRGIPEFLQFLENRIIEDHSEEKQGETIGAIILKATT